MYLPLKDILQISLIGVGVSWVHILNTCLDLNVIWSKKTINRMVKYFEGRCAVMTNRQAKLACKTMSSHLLICLCSDSELPGSIESSVCNHWFPRYSRNIPQSMLWPSPELTLHFADSRNRQFKSSVTYTRQFGPRLHHTRTPFRHASMLLKPAFQGTVVADRWIRRCEMAEMGGSV